jgi:hypothetical protein
VGRDRLPDDEFLDAAHVAHFPIALRALRVRGRYGMSGV